MRSDVRHGTDLNPTAAALLGLLLEQPMTGRDLVGEAEHHVGNFSTITRSQVYRERAGMESAGLVVHRRRPRGRVPRRDRLDLGAPGAVVAGTGVAVAVGGHLVLRHRVTRGDRHARGAGSTPGTSTSPAVATP